MRNLNGTRRRVLALQCGTVGAAEAEAAPSALSDAVPVGADIDSGPGRCGRVMQGCALTLTIALVRTQEKRAGTVRVCRRDESLVMMSFTTKAGMYRVRPSLI